MRVQALFWVLLFVVVAAAQFDIDDEDDVDAVEDVPFSPPQAIKLPVQSSSSSPMLDLSGIDLWDFRYEFLGILGIVGYIILHYYGRAANLKVAKDWLSATMPVFEANFAHLGDEKNFSLIRDGPNDFIFYASGRVHVEKVYGFIKLIPRMDLVNMAMGYAKMSPTAVASDRVEIKFTLSPELEGMVFAILRKKNAARITKSRYDLQDFTLPVKGPSRLPLKEYSIVTDSPEYAAALSEDDNIVKALWASLGLQPDGSGKILKTPIIESIILTDQEAELPKSIEDLKALPKTLQATFNIPAMGRSEGELMMNLVQMLMDFIDYSAQISLSAEQRTKLRKIRQGAEEKILKREEDKRKEELAKLKFQMEKDRENKMSPEELRKYEEKKRQAELKKKAKRGKISF
ncbi:hypothetical protein HK101_009350 [Irineochytrium annulatum]|nr:hypothetical protein HK101_009350 [Irineochytrium annulatum]